MSPADLLARGLSLPPPEEPPLELPSGSVCALSGEPIARGYRAMDVITEATAEFLDQFRGGVHGFVSEAAAACYASGDPRTGNPCARSHLAFEDAYYGPLVNLEAATQQGRPCWSRLVREVWPRRRGQRCLVLLTDDTKKRLWPKTRLGVLGEATRVFIHDGSIPMSSEVVLSWPRMLEALDRAEEAYERGFAKPKILFNLLADAKRTEQNGFRETVRLEAALKPWRGTPEFLFAVLIAQRPLKAGASGKKEKAQ